MQPDSTPHEQTLRETRRGVPCGASTDDLLLRLERLVEFARVAGSLVAGNQKLLAEIVWPHFFAIEIILVVLILMYNTIHELVRVIGKDKVLEMFFGLPPNAPG
jgi:hypothetical protein